MKIVSMHHRTSHTHIWNPGVAVKNTAFGTHFRESDTFCPRPKIADHPDSLKYGIYVLQNPAA